MTIANKYIQQCKSLFPVYGKLERTFLNRLKVQVNEHLDLFPDISYDELVKQFGSPREVVMEYYDNIEDDYLLSKIDLAKKVKKFLLFIAVLFLVYFFYQSYTTYQALNLIKDQQIIYEKQGTIEETK
ncbi:MAG: DUF6120 family protein [Anaerostipes hadrus]|nr:DUF6120 family protein [Anaerostipes hadrus]